MRTMEVEDRLRAELPDLADHLAETVPTTTPRRAMRAPADVPPPAAVEPIPVPPSRGRRSAVLVAAAIVLLAGAVGLSLVVPDDSDSTRTGSSPAAGDPDGATAPDGFGSWRAMADAPIPTRAHAVAAWTGDEVIFWAGSNLGRSFAYSDGATYDPVTDTWGDLAVPGWGHPGLTSAFDGRRLFALAKGGGVFFDTVIATWTDLPPVEGMFLSATVATDDAVWGLGPATGLGGDQPALAIARYEPDSDRWAYGPVLEGTEKMGPLFEDLVQLRQPVIWTGSEIVVWDTDGVGAAFDPVTMTWSRIPAPPVELGRVLDTYAVATDAGMTVLVRIDDGDQITTSMAVWDGDGWMSQELDVVIGPLEEATVVAAGDWLVVLGPDQPPITIHVPSGAWTVHDDGPLAGLQAPGAVWTSTELVVWGGVSSPSPTVDEPVEGAIWTPPPA